MLTKNCIQTRPLPHCEGTFCFGEQTSATAYRRVVMSKRVVFLLATAVFPLLILWFTFAPHSRAGGSTILIDAVYYDGYAASDTDEAVRLINVSAAAVDLSSWRLN